MLDATVREITAAYFGKSETSKWAQLGKGNINDTFRLEVKGKAYLLQRINTDIFQDPHGLMENYVRIHQHLQGQNLQLRLPAPLPCLTGKLIYTDRQNATWRLVAFLENSHAVEHASSLQQVLEASSVIGSFLKGLNSGTPPELTSTIPDFHHYLLRLRQFKNALQSDPLGRAKKLARETDYLLEKAAFFDTVAKWALKQRLVHNDPKIGNVLFNSENQAIALIDWDTVMPGILLNDFGDMVRTMASTALEDQEDLEQVGLNPKFLEGICQAFLPPLAPLLSETEKACLAFGPYCLILEQALRFLTDYILGDPYYKITSPQQNLLRARNQIKLHQEVIKVEDKIKAWVDRYTQIS